MGLGRFYRKCIFIWFYVMWHKSITVRWPTFNHWSLIFIWVIKCDFDFFGLFGFWLGQIFFYWRWLELCVYWFFLKKKKTGKKECTPIIIRKCTLCTLTISDNLVKMTISIVNRHIFKGVTLIFNKY